MINFRKNIHLYYDFFTTAEFGSLTKAAMVLGVNESTVHRSIKRLERLMLTKLIISDPTGSELTDEGKKLYRELLVKFNK